MNEQPGWTTDENGTKFFRHNGWEVKVLGPEWTWGCMDVTSPWEMDDVFVSDDVLQIDRRLPRGRLDVQSVVVPLPVLKAITEARAMIEEKDRKVMEGGQ